jgi:hypothetical protein
MKGLRYISVKVGRELAKAARLHLDQQRVRLMFGVGADAGRIAVAVDMSGDFLAKRQNSGEYHIVINRHTAENLFSLDFPPFTEERCEAIAPENGQPPRFIKASPEMLAVED